MNEKLKRVTARGRRLTHRIAALLSALMIAVTAMPAITAMADEERTVSIKAFIKFEAEEESAGTYDMMYIYDYDITGSGKFVMVTYYNSFDNDEYFSRCSYILSDTEFTLDGSYSVGSSEDFAAGNETVVSSVCSALEYNGVYYYPVFGVTSGYTNSYAVVSGLTNYRQTDERFSTALKADIDAGYFDLSRDDYLSDEAGESDAVYYKELDFASISADYKVKYTIEKNSDGKYEFISPDEAGIQFDWTNRTDIDGAYVKFTVYGEYYDSFWSTSYTNTYVTLTCERKNDLSYLCVQNDMVSLAKEKCSGSKGYGFVVNYVYVQAFANIDGTMCRSRIYKFDSDLVSDYGNADSEDDEWVPEISDGESMPSDYEPDPDNTDPEKTEPSPDEDDDTVIDTPIDDESDVVINDDTTYLVVFKQFINVLKQGTSYLGDFPSLVSEVFSFFPSIFILFIGIGFAVALILRFIGR